MSIKVWAILLLMALLLVSSVSAIGISPAIKTLEYKPGATYMLEFRALGANTIDVYTRGDLAQYAEIIDSDPGGGPRSFRVQLILPDKLEPPGKRTLLVGVIESAPEASQIGARAAYQAPVFIFVPYPGIYLEMEFAAPSVNVNESVNFSIVLKNRGTDTVPAVKPTIQISDSNRVPMTVLDAPAIKIPGSSEGIFRIGWDTRGYKAGPYFANVTVRYGQNTMSRELPFRIGVQILTILNHTTEAKAGKINPFDIFVRSEWNSAFDSVFGTVTIGDQSFNTPTINLEPFRDGMLRGYWDATRVKPGIYDAEITVSYSDTHAFTTGKITVAEAEVESPTGAITGGFGIGARVAVALVLAVIAGVIIYIRRRREQYE